MLYYMMSLHAVTNQESREKIGWYIIISICVLFGLHVSNSVFQQIRFANNKKVKNNFDKKADSATALTLEKKTIEDEIRL